MKIGNCKVPNFYFIMREVFFLKLLFKTRYVLRLSILFYILVLVGCSQSSNSQGPLPNQDLVGKLTRIAPLFVMSYTQKFAQRFNLPEQNARSLSVGLDAIAVEIRPQSAQIDCLVHLYINNQVSVYVPNNKTDFSLKTWAEYFFVTNYTKADLRYNTAEVDKSLTRIVYRSKSVAKGQNGWVDTPEIYRFKFNFLPDLSLLSLDVGCSNLNPEYAPPVPATIRWDWRIFQTLKTTT